MPQVCWILYLNLPSQTLFATGLRVLELFEMCPVIQIRHNSCISTCMCPTFTFESSLNRLCKKVVFPTPMFPSTHSVNSCHKVVKQKKHVRLCSHCLSESLVKDHHVCTPGVSIARTTNRTNSSQASWQSRLCTTVSRMTLNWWSTFPGLNEVHVAVCNQPLYRGEGKFWSLQWPLWTSNLAGATTCRNTIQMKWNVVTSVWDLSTPDLASLT